MRIVLGITLMVNDIRVFRSGNFPLKGKKPEVVALEWIRQINRQDFVISKIIKVVYDGDKDITEEVTKLFKQ